MVFFKSQKSRAHAQLDRFRAVSAQQLYRWLSPSFYTFRLFCDDTKCQLLSTRVVNEEPRPVAVV
jgi:hypothetical protein